MTEKQQFIAFWAPSIGEDEAAKAWDLKNESRQSAYVLGDLPGYESPVTGKWVEGRAQRREDLKRTGSRPWEGREQEMKVAMERKREVDRAMDRAAEATAWKAWHQLSPSSRRALEGR